MIKQLFNKIVTLLGFNSKPIVFIKNGGVLIRASARSAGYDLINAEGSAKEINPGQRLLIKTGIFMALPEGYEAQVRPRSGLALKYGISVVNTPGTIDSKLNLIFNQ